MKYRWLLIIFFFSPYIEASCDLDGCNTIGEFANSYVQALLSKNNQRLKNHYYSDKYVCYLDQFDFDWVYRGHNISEQKELKGKDWDHFLLTFRSEATKIKLFYEFKASSPELSDREIMGMIYKELPKPDLKRVSLSMEAKPTHQVRLSIYGELYNKNHPCFAYARRSGNLYLLNTKQGYKAVEPMCDVERVVGRQRIDRGDSVNSGDDIFKSLSLSQLNKYKELLQSGRISTVKRFAKDLAVSYSTAKYVVLEKICPMIP